MVKLFCILNAFNRFDKKGMKTSNPLPSRRLSGLSVLWFIKGDQYLSPTHSPKFDDPEKVTYENNVKKREKKIW